MCKENELNLCFTFFDARMFMHADVFVCVSDICVYCICIYIYIEAETQMKSNMQAPEKRNRNRRNEKNKTASVL